MFGERQERRTSSSAPDGGIRDREPHAEEPRTERIAPLNTCPARRHRDDHRLKGGPAFHDDPRVASAREAERRRGASSGVRESLRPRSYATKPTPHFLPKYCPVVEWLSYSPPGPGVACRPRLRCHRSLRAGHEPAPGGWSRRSLTSAGTVWSSIRTKALSHRSTRLLSTSLANSPTLGSRRASSARGTRPRQSPVFNTGYAGLRSRGLPAVALCLQMNGRRLSSEPPFRPRSRRERLLRRHPPKARHRSPLP